MTVYVCGVFFVLISYIKGDIRLIDANGVNQGEGIVEIFNGGTWNRVCSDAWDDNDAVVVCRQLGLK